MANESYTIKIAFPAPSQDIAYKIGFLILKNLQEELSGSRSGRWYPVPGNAFYDKITPKEARAKNYYAKFTGARSRAEIKGTAYQASAPGEPPAQRTGRLRQSFFFTVDPDSESDKWYANIRTNVRYADDLEYGTERVDPRPFMKPAVERALPEAKRLYDEFAYEIVRNR